jgi:hypothetical protein
MDAVTGDTLEWRVHLARQQPGRAAGAVAAILLASAAALWLFASPGFALVTGGLLLAATGEFLFPTTYRLTASGAEARNPFGWRKITWKEVKRVYAGNEEIKLSPLAHGGPRESFRGVLLRCAGNHEAVRSAVHRFHDAATRS